jgi:hypothetical protein
MPRSSSKGRLATLARRAAAKVNKRALIAILAILLSLTAASGFGRIVLYTIMGLLGFRETGYPDSAVLLRGAEAMASLHLYPPLDRPPYLVTAYGPLTYLLFGLTHGLAEVLGIDAAVTARGAVLLAFLCCVLAVYRLIKATEASQTVALICVALLLCSPAFALWTTQCRGDFLAAALSLFSLLAVTLGSVSGLLIAALLCAGAILTKQSFVSATIAIAAWLALRRRHGDCARFLAVVLACVGASYGLLLWREPLMATHWTVFRDVALDPMGALVIGLGAASQPIMVAGGGALILVVAARRSLLAAQQPFLVLFVLYFVTAAVIATLGAIHAAAMIHYYWEPLFAAALVTSAVPQAWRDLRDSTLARRLAALLTVAFAMSLLLNLAYVPAMRRDAQAFFTHYAASRAQWSALAELIAGKRVLSTEPDIAVLSAVPELPDPFLNSTLEKAGRWDSAPVVRDIEERRYRMLFVNKETWEGGPKYRGLERWSPAIRAAMLRNYRPACDIFGMRVLLPDTGDMPLRTKLMAIGCSASGQ